MGCRWLWLVVALQFSNNPLHSQTGESEILLSNGWPFTEDYVPKEVLSKLCPKLPANLLCRFLAVASASAAATTLVVFTHPEAAQAKRNKPPPEEKKVELEDKSLSKNEQRALANARRKEAMKATVEAAKAKAKSISSPQ